MTLVYTSTSGPSDAVVELSTPGPCRHATIRTIGTDDVTNESTLPGSTLTEALAGVSVPATGSEPGYLSRLWFTTPGTFVVWATAADVPPGDEIELVAWSGGGAGGVGTFQTTTGTSNNPSAAGGGGARRARRFVRSFIVGNLPISVTVGDEAVAPAPLTTVAVSQPSTPGTATFWTGSSGVLCSCYGGGAGQWSNLCSGGGGGGFLGTGPQNNTGSFNNGGQPGANANLGTGVSGGGGGGGDEGNTQGDNGFAACGGGGGGGGSGSASLTNGANGGNADEGAGGGGGAGKLNSTSGLPGATGGRGGGSGLRSDGVLNGSGAAGGITGPPGGPGADAPDLPATDINYYRSGDGGGGGAPSSVLGQVGGRGGNGGAPGGGGGAGGHGRGASGTAWGGAGGRGARGQAACTFYL